MLTDEQVENFRRVLFAQFGEYALVMPRWAIQAHHDKLQSLLDKLPAEKQAEPPKKNPQMVEAFKKAGLIK